jgi:hypothetical protein
MVFEPLLELLLAVIVTPLLLKLGDGNEPQELDAEAIVDP